MPYDKDSADLIADVKKTEEDAEIEIKHAAEEGLVASDGGLPTFIVIVIITSIIALFIIGFIVFFVLSYCPKCCAK
jgi:hypothetical protein